MVSETVWLFFPLRAGLFDHQVLGLALALSIAVKTARVVAMDSSVLIFCGASIFVWVECRKRGYPGAGPTPRVGPESILNYP